MISWSLRNRVDSPGVEGVALGDAPDGEAGTSPEAVLSDCLISVL